MSDPKLEEMEVKLTGAEERSKLVLNAKNNWADRARAAEAKLAEVSKIRDDALVARFQAEDEASHLRAKLAEAKDRIAGMALATQIDQNKLAEVSAERDRQRGAAEKYYAESERLRKIIKDELGTKAELQAEVERLREALQNISKMLMCNRDHTIPERHCEACGKREDTSGYWCAGCIARVALRGEPRLSTEEEESKQ